MSYATTTSGGFDANGNLIKMVVQLSFLQWEYVIYLMILIHRI